MHVDRQQRCKAYPECLFAGPDQSPSPLRQENHFPPNLFGLLRASRTQQLRSQADPRSNLGQEKHSTCFRLSYVPDGVSERFCTQGAQEKRRGLSGSGAASSWSVSFWPSDLPAAARRRIAPSLCKQGPGFTRRAWILVPGLLDWIRQGERQLI